MFFSLLNTFWMLANRTCRNNYRAGLWNIFPSALIHCTMHLSLCVQWVFARVLMACNTCTGGPLWLAADILELDNTVLRIALHRSCGEGSFPDLLSFQTLLPRTATDCKRYSLAYLHALKCKNRFSQYVLYFGHFFNINIGTFSWTCYLQCCLFTFTFLTWPTSAPKATVMWASASMKAHR